MLSNLISTSDKFLIGMHGKLLADTLDVQGLLESDGASEALSGVNNMLDSYGSSGFKLTQKLGLFCVAIGVVGIGITLMVSGGNANKRAEIKESVPWKVIGACVIFGAVAVVGFLQSIGVNLFTVAN